MRIEVMQHYGLDKPFTLADYLETDHAKQLSKHVKGAILEGRLIALCGIVGSGKTMLLRKLQDELREENRETVSKSQSVEKHRVTLETLIAALFYDLSPDKQKFKIPQREKRERDLSELVKKTKKPVVLFIDEAQDLNGNTLNGLKRLMEVIKDGGGLLSIVLVGKPRLKYVMNRGVMEEICFRVDVFDFDGMAGVQRRYIEWLLKDCGKRDALPGDMVTDEAVDLLAEKLRTPLQIQWHLTRALEAGYEAGEKPVSASVVESVLLKQIDDLEPTLKRMGFGVRDLAEQIEAKPAEIRALFDNQLDPARTTELREKMLRAGLPV
ncbi:MAG: AAA family ATPase [Pseudomonadota bacterium]